MDEARVPERAPARSGGRRGAGAHRGAAGEGARGGALGAAHAAERRRHGRRLPLLRLHERGDRPLALGAARLRLPGAGRRQRRDPAPVRHAGAAGALPRAARRRPGAVVLLDDRAGRGRLRPDAPAHEGGARRRRVGDRRPQVVLERRGRRRPSGSCSRSPTRMRRLQARDDDPGAGRHARARDRAPDVGDGPRRAGLEHPLRGALRGRPGPGREHARRARRGVPARPEAPRPGPDPPRHALARADAAGLRPDVLLRARARGVRRPAGRQADGAELDRRLRRRRSRPAGC